MDNLTQWTINFLKNESLELRWLEDRKTEWIPLLSSRLKYLFNGTAFILICDEERKWFEKYFLQNINNKKNARPLLPFFSLSSIYKNYNNIKTNEDIALLDDMLSIVFQNKYIYFYIGKADAKESLVAKSHDLNYMWLFDEKMPNSFYLNSNDEFIDLKLISLFRIFNKSIEAVLFGKVQL